MATTVTTADEQAHCRSDDDHGDLAPERLKLSHDNASTPCLSSDMLLVGHQRLPRLSRLLSCVELRRSATSGSICAQRHAAPRRRGHYGMARFRAAALLSCAMERTVP